MTSDFDARLDAAAALRDLNHAFVAHDRDPAGLRELQASAAAKPRRCAKGAAVTGWP